MDAISTQQHAFLQAVAAQVDNSPDAATLLGLNPDVHVHVRDQGTIEQGLLLAFHRMRSPSEGATSASPLGFGDPLVAEIVKGILSEAPTAWSWLERTHTVGSFRRSHAVLEPGLAAFLTAAGVESGDQGVADRLLGEIFDRTVYPGAPHLQDQSRIESVLGGLDALDGASVQRVTTTSQRALHQVSRFFSNPAVQTVLGLYLGYRSFILMRRGFTWIQDRTQLTLLPKFFSLVMRKAPVPVAKAMGMGISGVQQVWNRRYQVLGGMILADWVVPRFVPAAQPYTSKMRKAAWQMILLPFTIFIGVPFVFAAAIYKGQKSASTQVNQTLHQWVNRQEADDLARARQIWIDTAKQHMNIATAVPTPAVTS